MTRGRGTHGNRIELLENGEAYFPRVFDAIANAKREVIVETFILFDDKVGRALQAALIGAAERGVRFYAVTGLRARKLLGAARAG